MALVELPASIPPGGDATMQPCRNSVVYQAKAGTRNMCPPDHVAKHGQLAASGTRANSADEVTPSRETSFDPSTP